MGRVLSDDRLSRFATDGFLFPVLVMSRSEAADLRQQFEAFDDGPEAGADGSKLHRYYKFKTHLLFDWADAIVHNARLLDAVEDIIGPDILVWSTGVFDKPPRSPNRIPWHQDGIYAGFKGGRVVRAWVALTPARVSNGTMKYLPGSHRRGLLRHEDAIGETGAGSLATRGEHIVDELDTRDQVHVEVQAGEASLHHFAIVHSSEPNESDERRLSIAATFMSPDTRPMRGADCALLVRGDDGYGHWNLERRMLGGFDARDRAQHAASMAMRNRVFFGGADALPAGVVINAD